MSPTAARAVRRNSRRRLILDATAALLRARGFHGTSIRDIAAAADTTPATIYRHFASKTALLLTIYREAVEVIAAWVDAAIAAAPDPRRQLIAACEAHLEMLLDQSDYAQVLIRVLPQDVPEVATELTMLRDGYEQRFKRLIDELPLPRTVNRRHLRLFVLGALNWTQVWYRPGGESPRTIARRLIAVIHGLDEDVRHERRSPAARSAAKTTRH
jgi:TetR/AcrR family transcriptional regulator, cholesterol catabolism regulator